MIMPRTAPSPTYLELFLPRCNNVAQNKESVIAQRHRPKITYQSKNLCPEKQVLLAFEIGIFVLRKELAQVVSLTPFLQRCSILFDSLANVQLTQFAFHIDVSTAQVEAERL